MSIFHSSCFKFIYCMQIEISDVKSYLTYAYYTIQNMMLINTRVRTRKNHEYFYASMLTTVFPSNLFKYADFLKFLRDLTNNSAKYYDARRRRMCI
jgi:hypothetical protein